MKKIMDEFSMTQEQLSRRIGKSRPAVANALRLLTLPQEVLEMMDRGQLTAGHARAAVSYTHLDVYKRQPYGARLGAGRHHPVRLRHRV